MDQVFNSCSNIFQFSNKDDFLFVMVTENIKFFKLLVIIKFVNWTIDNFHFFFMNDLTIIPNNFLNKLFQNMIILPIIELLNYLLILYNLNTLLQMLYLKKTQVFFHAFTNLYDFFIEFFFNFCYVRIGEEFIMY